MTKPKVILYKKAISKDLIQILEQNFDLAIFDGIKNDLDGFMKALQTAEGLIGWGGRIDKAFLDKAPLLKVVSTISVGYDHCDLEEMNRRGIYMMHTPTVLTESVADAAITLMLSAARRTVYLDKIVRTGNWRRTIGPEGYAVDFYNKTLGIVGMGRIGKAIARRAHFGFGMPILYHSRSRHQDAETQLKAQFCQFEPLLQKSDFVCCVLPNTPETRHMFNEKAFSLMPAHSIFVNVGRGQAVDETALYEALKSKSILAAGLDVFEKEPLSPDSPLIGLENIVLSPHTASATFETRHNMDVCAVENLILAMRQKPEANCVNPEIRI